MLNVGFFHDMTSADCIHKRHEIYFSLTCVLHGVSWATDLQCCQSTVTVVQRQHVDTRTNCLEKLQYQPPWSYTVSINKTLSKPAGTTLTLTNWCLRGYANFWSSERKWSRDGLHGYNPNKYVRAKMYLRDPAYLPQLRTSSSCNRAVNTGLLASSIYIRLCRCCELC